MGPAQAPRHEKISFSDRAHQLEISREGLRVNPPSDRRLYTLDGYETESYIDPRRTKDVPLPLGKPQHEAPPSATHTALMFETAAVGVKVRNVNLMGGERVKEMDHFVASVEIPSLHVKIPDIAPLVVAEACVNAMPIMVPDVGGAFPVYVQLSLRTAGGDGVSQDVEGCARTFRRALWGVCQVLEFPFESLRMYYMVTMRADACVCQRSPSDGMVYVNLMVFQQQTDYDVATLTVKSKRTWQYWLQRVAMVTTPEGAPPGLYNPAIRARFKAMLATQQLQ